MRTAFSRADARYQATGDREAALEMEELTTTAQAMAEAAYEASDQYKAVQDAERAVPGCPAGRNTAALEASTAAYGLAQERTKGERIFRHRGQRRLYGPGLRQLQPHRHGIQWTGPHGKGPFTPTPSGWNGCPMTTYPALAPRGRAGADRPGGQEPGPGMGRHPEWPGRRAGEGRGHGLGGCWPPRKHGADRADD